MDNLCLSMSCMNGNRDERHGETDEDCGGPCPGCGLGKNCDENSDCSSGVCVNMLCAPCVSNGSCGDGEYCAEDGGCQQKKPVGADCDEDYECSSDKCSSDECTFDD